MITEYIKADILFDGGVRRVNFNISARLLRLADLIRMRINPNMTRTDFIEVLFLQFVQENQEMVEEILDDYEITMEEL